MREKTKPEEKSEPENKQNGKTKKRNSQNCELVEGSYYYDDAHGYEIYKPEPDDEEENGN